MNKRQEGAARERTALLYLQKKGMCLVAQNFRCRTGEIDLIMRDGNTYVFAEVKYRRTKGAGDPLEAVGYAKRRRITGAARFFLARYGIPDSVPCRFDVVGILGDEISHIENAFDAVF